MPNVSQSAFGRNAGVRMPARLKSPGFPLFPSAHCRSHVRRGLRILSARRHQGSPYALDEDSRGTEAWQQYSANDRRADGGNGSDRRPRHGGSFAEHTEQNDDQKKEPRFQIAELHQRRRDAMPPVDVTIKRLLVSSARYRDELSGTEIARLQHSGLRIKDLPVWLTFVQQRGHTLAINKLQKHLHADPELSLPMDLFRKFLERQDIPAGSLRVAFAIFNNERSMKLRRSALEWSILHKALMGHVRRIAPDMIEDVMKFLIQGLRSSSGSSHELQDVIDRAMSQTAIATSHNPFANAKHQEAALVHALSFMAEHEPPLSVGARGYLALATVQLLLPKTQRERYWARLKALSWPPWKRDRTAMDSLLGPEYSTSKAEATMDRMHEDGYVFEDWSDIARIYAGHDTDGTPTIQTRAIMPHYLAHSDSGMLWAARIQATRTLQEAWACWLTYTNERDEKSFEHVVVLTMMKKICARLVLNARPSRTIVAEDDYEEVLPGDSLEIFPEPASTHLQTYTRTPPPSLDQFFESLQARDHFFDGTCVCFLMNHASSFKHGLKYLSAHGAGNMHYHPSQTSVDGSPMWTNKNVHLRAALANLYLRFTRGKIDQRLNVEGCPMRVPEQLASSRYPLELNKRFARAIWLLACDRDDLSRVKDPKLWHPLFYRLTSKPAEYCHFEGGSDVRTERFESSLTIRSFHFHRMRVLAFRLMQQALDLAKRNVRPARVDACMFEQACRAMSRAGDSRRWAKATNNLVEALGGSGSGLPYDLILQEVDDILRESPEEYLDSLYKDFAGLQGLDCNLSLPHLTHLTPLSPANIHAWVRALGTWGRQTALRDLVETMCTKNLISFDEAVVTDRRHLRQLIIAIRTFLECSPEAATYGTAMGRKSLRAALDRQSMDNLYPPDLAGAPKDTIDAVKQALEARFGEYGCWPNDEEVDAYMSEHGQDRDGHVTRPSDAQSIEPNEIEKRPRRVPGSLNGEDLSYAASF